VEDAPSRAPALRSTKQWREESFNHDAQDLSAARAAGEHGLPFTPPDGCELVDGKTNPKGWCLLFAPKPK